jgi:hypothetical protein
VCCKPDPDAVKDAHAIGLRNSRAIRAIAAGTCQNRIADSENATAFDTRYLRIASQSLHLTRL